MRLSELKGYRTERGRARFLVIAEAYNQLVPFVNALADGQQGDYDVDDLREQLAEAMRLLQAAQQALAG